MNEQHSAPQPKKERLIFLLIAYGLTFLMGLPLAIAQRGGYNTDVFPNAQMYYPAAGVMLAYLAARRPSLPRRFFVFYLLNTAALVASCLGAVLAPGDVWLAAANLIVVAGSALAEQQNSDFFEPFFADGGAYASYVSMVTAQYDVVKMKKKQYRIGATFSVSKDQLRKDLEKAGVLKGLGAGF